MKNTNQIAVFEQKQIRRVEHDGEMWLSVVDIIEVLTDSKDPSDYWTTIKRRENQLPTNCRKFKFLAADGKMRATDCANTEGVRMAGDARKNFEKNIGESVVSKENFLGLKGEDKKELTEPNEKPE